MVEAAHLSGRPVAVHATTDKAVRMAVDAGADSIEHGHTRVAKPPSAACANATSRGCRR